jgi:hypothetical protein
MSNRRIVLVQLVELFNVAARTNLIAETQRVLVYPSDNLLRHIIVGDLPYTVANDPELHAELRPFQRRETRPGHYLIYLVDKNLKAPTGYHANTSPMG